MLSFTIIWRVLRTIVAVVLGIVLIATGWSFMDYQRGTWVLGPLLGVIYGLGWYLWMRVFGRRAPPERREPRLAPPEPGGVRIGRFYFNPHDRRFAAHDSYGRLLINHAHRGAWPLLALEIVVLTFLLGSLVWYVILWSLHG